MQRHLTTLMMFGMPLALLHSQLISISVPQPRAYREAQASAVQKLLALALVSLATPALTQPMPIPKQGRG